MDTPHNSGAPVTPTLHELVRSLGKQSNVVAQAHALLLNAGYTYTRTAIYTTIQKNGTNNATIAAAVLDAIEAEKTTRATLEARKSALAT